MSGKSKRAMLAAAFAEQQKEENKSKIEETPIDELLSDEEVENEEAEKSENKEVLLSEHINKNMGDTFLINESAKQEKAIQPIKTVPEMNLEESQHFILRSGAMRRFSQKTNNDEIKKEGINLRYSTENEDFIRIQAMKNRMSMTEFIIAVVDEFKNEIVEEEISDELFAKNAKVGRRYDRTYGNHRYVFPEDITFFFQEESARRGMSVPIFFEFLLNKYKQKTV